MLNQKAKALIFDLDGTLADTMPLHFLSWMDSSRKYGFPFDEKVFHALAGMPAEQIIRLLAKENGLALDAAAIAREKEINFLQYLPRVKPIDKVARIARENYGRLPMAIGTGGSREIAQKTLAVIALESHFPIMITAEDVVRHKPAPDTFLECARLMKVDPCDCQVFEDGDKGLDAARAAGMIACDIRIQ